MRVLIRPTICYNQFHRYRRCGLYVLYDVLCDCVGPEGQTHTPSLLEIEMSRRIAHDGTCNILQQLCRFQPRVFLCEKPVARGKQQRDRRSRVASTSNTLACLVPTRIVN